MPGSLGWRGMRSQETARAVQGSPRVRVMRSQQTEYIRIQEKLRVMPTLSLRSSVRIKVQLGHLLSYTHSTRVGNFQHVFAYSKLGATCASTKTGEICPRNSSKSVMHIYENLGYMRCQLLPWLHAPSTPAVVTCAVNFYRGYMRRLLQPWLHALSTQPVVTCACCRTSETCRWVGASSTMRCVLASCYMLRPLFGCYMRML